MCSLRSAPPVTRGSAGAAASDTRFHPPRSHTCVKTDLSPGLYLEIRVTGEQALGWCTHADRGANLYLRRRSEGASSGEPLCQHPRPTTPNPLADSGEDGPRPEGSCPGGASRVTPLRRAPPVPPRLPPSPSLTVGGHSNLSHTSINWHCPRRVKKTYPVFYCYPIRGATNERVDDASEGLEALLASLFHRYLSLPPSTVNPA